MALDQDTHKPLCWLRYVDSFRHHPNAFHWDVEKRRTLMFLHETRRLLEPKIYSNSTHIILPLRPWLPPPSQRPWIHRFPALCGVYSSYYWYLKNVSFTLLEPQKGGFQQIESVILGNKMKSPVTLWIKLHCTLIFATGSWLEVLECFLMFLSVLAITKTQPSKSLRWLSGHPECWLPNQHDIAHRTNQHMWELLGS
jgi:hypothetical protein